MYTVNILINELFLSKPVHGSYDVAQHLNNYCGVNKMNQYINQWWGSGKSLVHLRMCGKNLIQNFKDFEFRFYCLSF